MMQRRSFCALAVSAVAGFLAPAALGKDTVVGRVWEMKIAKPRERGGGGGGPRRREEAVTKRFRATPDGKLFSAAGEEIGSFTEKGDEVSLKIEADGPLKGSHKLVKRDKNPPTWQGVWTLRDDSKRTVHLTLKKD